MLGSSIYYVWVFVIAIGVRFISAAVYFAFVFFRPRCFRRIRTYRVVFAFFGPVINTAVFGVLSMNCGHCFTIKRVCTCSLITVSLFPSVLFRNSLFLILEAIWPDPDVSIAANA